MIRSAALLLLLVIATSAATHDYQKPTAVHLDHDGRKWVDKILKKLTLEQKIGQMLIPLERLQGFMNEDSSEAKRLHDEIQRYHLGGIVFTIPVENGQLQKTLPYEAAMWNNRLQQDSEVPLIIAADFERGPAMRMNGVSIFPAAMAFGATGKPELAERYGEIVAQESRALNVQWNFFPVADVNSNAANPIINTRSFGEDPRAVGEFVAAYIRGAKKNGMLSTAKHFPGHGDTATDTHLSRAVVSGDRARLNSVELPPFRRAIEAGVESVMVAHVTVPALEPDRTRVATLSPAIETELLKQELGFHGLVVTDAMDMNAAKLTCEDANCSADPDPIAGLKRTVFQAVKSGADVVLQPGDLGAAYDALLDAVKHGDISEERINQSVRKILELKASVGLHKAKLVDIEQVEKRVAQPENVAFGQSVADQAITLVRENGKAMPWRRSPPRPQGALSYGNSPQRAGERGLAIVFSDDVRAETGQQVRRELFNRIPEAAVIQVDPVLAGPLTERVLQAVDRAQSVLAVVAITPSAGKMMMINGQLTSTVALDDAAAALLHAVLQRAPEKTIVVALGSPYLAQQFPEIQNYLCTYSSERVSEISTIKAVFGEIPIHGRLPVTIPNIAPRGTGLDRPAGGQNENQH